jgi:hypothetical protein
LQKDIGDTCDDGDPTTNNDEVDSNCDCAGIPNGTGTLATELISTSSNDAEEKDNGNVSTTSSDLEMIIDGANTQIVGLRFTGLNIDQGMNIISAMIQFSADGDDENIDPCTLDIYGQDIDNAPIFTSSSNNISTRTKTTAKVEWSPEKWLTDNERGPNQRTINIASVIQEIVNRSGYTSSSAIAILIEGTGKRRAFSFNGAAAKAAEITIIYDSSPLPIELLGVTAKTQENDIRIDWSTATETNNDFFTIERSFDGRDFQAIGTVSGKGTTTEISNYTFLDKNPKRGLNYYRLKQTDFDGQYSYSRVVSAEFESTNNTQVFPTVVDDILTIQRSGDNNEESSIIIHDITGRSFKHSIITNNEFKKEISLVDLIPGVYFVSIYNDQSVETFKIVKL